MKKPVLVIMAAGMGSRYGGLKQIDPVDREGHIIMDFSIFDAKRAGFEKVIFIIKKENEADFKEAVGDRMAKIMDVEYAFQDLHNIPEGFEVPEGRVKPWGTAHAVLSAIDLIDGPFAVINADDYYGKHAFEVIYNYLTTHEDDDKYRYTMVGYRLKNTVTDNGHVARGICELNENKELVKVTERTRIEKRDGGIAYSEDDGETWVDVDGDTLVSMNMWGFTRSILDEIQAGMGRSGDIWAFQDSGIVPDAMLISKAIGGSQPLSVVVYDRSLDAWTAGAHAGTFRGNQLAMAAGTVVLGRISSPAFLAAVKEKGARIRKGIEEIRKDFPIIADIRGRGLMLGIEFADPGDKKDIMGHPVPSGKLAAEVQRRCFEKGLIMEKGGRNGSTMRCLCALNVSDSEIDTMLTIFREAVKEAADA